MKLLLTGGHLSPLLAVLDKVPDSWEVLVIGRKHGFEGDRSTTLEYKTLKKRGIPFATIVTGRLQRTITRHTIISLLKIPYGFVQSIFILKTFRPDVVLSFGGYLSIPVTIGASILGIPVVIHEQTLKAGFANRVSGLFAKKICISRESSKNYFPKEKTILTGNPVRKFSPSTHFVHSGQEFKIENTEKLPIIYITGGSSGAHAINMLIEGCIIQLLKQYVVIHQTGDAKEFNDFERLKKFRDNLTKEKRERYILTKFIDPEQIGSIMKASDLVVSRSGVNTITELLHFGKPSLLIPLPTSGNNEQYENAVFLKDVGLGKIVRQQQLTSQRLFDEIQTMVKNLNQYTIKEQVPLVEDAADKILGVVQSVYVDFKAKKASREQ